MNLPNKLTILRILFVPFFIAAMLINFPCHNLAALALFGLASFTDMLDGKIARKQNLVTNFGKFSDPLADKILVLSALVCFVQVGLCDCVVVIVVLFREFAVMSVRLLAASEGKVVAANIWGKAKTVAQIVAIVIVFILQIIREIIGFRDAALADGLGFPFFIAGEAAMWISTVLCIISGVIYLAQNREFISMK